jgi:hypothetical protein
MGSVLIKKVFRRFFLTFFILSIKIIGETKHPLGLKMRKLYLVIGFVVILAIVCSPALAISKSDLISQYKGQSSPTIPIVVPTTTPTTTPTTITDVDPTITDGDPLSALSVTSTPSRAMVFFDGSFKGFTPIYIDGLSVGTTHQLRVLLEGYEAYSTDVLIKNEQSCHMTSWWGLEAFVCDDQKQTIDVTLKKVESTQKLTIPTIVPTTAPMPKPSHTPCPPGTPYWICFA